MDSSLKGSSSTSTSRLRESKLRELTRVLRVQVGKSLALGLRAESERATEERKRERGSGTNQKDEEDFDVAPLQADAKLLNDLTQLVVQYSRPFAADLLAFANHAKRKTLRREDVMLCARKSPALIARLEAAEATRMDCVGGGCESTGGREKTNGKVQSKARARAESSDNSDEGTGGSSGDGGRHRGIRFSSSASSGDESSRAAAVGKNRELRRGFQRAGEKATNVPIEVHESSESEDEFVALDNDDDSDDEQELEMHGKSRHGNRNKKKRKKQPQLRSSNKSKKKGRIQWQLPHSDNSDFD